MTRDPMTPAAFLDLLSGLQKSGTPPDSLKGLAVAAAHAASASQALCARLIDHGLAFPPDDIPHARGDLVLAGQRAQVACAALARMIQLIGEPPAS